MSNDIDIPHDINKWQKALEEIGLLRSIVKHIPEAVCVIDFDGNIVSWNETAEKIFGYKAEEVLQKEYAIIVPPELTERDVMGFTVTLSGVGLITSFESQRITKGGKTIPVEITAVATRDDGNRITGYAAITRDITEQKEAQRRQELLNTILSELNNSNDILNLIHRILILLKDFTGIEAVGIRLQEGEDFPYYETDGFPENFIEAEKHLCTRDGNNEIIRDAEGNPCLECMCGNIIRRRTSASFPFFTEIGSFWSNNTTKLLASTSEEDRQAGTRNRCNGEGYESVALIPLKSGENIIGLLQLNDKQPDCFTLDLIHFLEKIGASIGIAISRKQAEDAIKNEEKNLRRIIEHNVDSMIIVDAEGIMQFVNPATESLFALPKTKLLGSCFGFPMLGNERTEIEIVRPSGHGTTMAEMDTVEIEWQGKPSYLVSLHDITARKLAEEKLKTITERLRKTLAGTIKVMSSMVETRDPYTAGHQRRVSTLARVIAQEMGLSDDIIENVRMAGVIHDIGKIAVPAELLTKPGKITNIEMSLIKVHAQSGYDILKDVELPYPTAEIVLQHHERIDGSGYPNGLKGDLILKEARIVAVADVVEAMSSHRPYRAAKGIDVALEEIENNAGVLYDSKVAEVCLRLFREKGFVFE